MALLATAVALGGAALSGYNSSMLPSSDGFLIMKNSTDDSTTLAPTGKLSGMSAGTIHIAHLRQDDLWRQMQALLQESSEMHLASQLRPLQLLNHVPTHGGHFSQWRSQFPPYWSLSISIPQ